MKKIFLLIISLQILYSCKEKNSFIDISPFKSTKRFYEKDFDTYKIFHENQYHLLTRAEDIIIKDKFVIVSTLEQKKPLKIFNKVNLKLICEGGNYGRGPGEQLSFYKMSNIQNSNYFWVSDIVTRRITKYNTELLLTDTSYCPENQINLSNNKFSIYSPVKIDSLIIGASFDGVSRIYFCDSLGNLLKKGGKYPLKRDEKVSNEINANAYYGKLDAYKNKFGDFLIVKSNAYSPIIEFYNKEGKEKIILYGPDVYSPTYKIVKSGGQLAFSPNKDIRIAAMDVVITENYVYVLYSGKKNDENFSALNCNTIYQFDWLGKTLKRFILDKGIYSFTIDEKKNVIYGGATDGFLYYFPLK